MHHLRQAEHLESVVERREAAEAGGHEHQCSEKAILRSLVFGVHSHEDGQGAENADPKNREEKKVRLEYLVRDKKL